uniref:Putative ovule protein n=1 Tax=Solanum chacoense TaxID=4108 RepID=A0A0V0GLP3_SOLCH
MPLGGNSNSVDIWNGVLEKCEKKLARWKTQYLSFEGRLTLINSVLDSLPTHMMTLFPIPARVIKRLDSIGRKFLWHGNKERKGFNLVKWKVVITDKKVGGMGIKELEGTE